MKVYMLISALMAVVCVVESQEEPTTTVTASPTRRSGLRLRGKFGNRLRNRFKQVDRLNITLPPTTTVSTTTHMDEGVTIRITEDGVVMREPLTRSQVNRAQVAIRKLVNDNRTPRGHHPFNAGILRLSFHDCVGILGCDGCINHDNRANSGVLFYALALDRLWREQFSHTMSLADFWSLAGITVARFAMELNPNCKGPGCVPDIPFYWGRNDCGVAHFFGHTFCPIHSDATHFFTDEFGLSKKEYTALMGGHTLGRVNTPDGGTWDKTPDYFDNDYYKQLLNAANVWRIANRTSVPELNESWVNTGGANELLMLGSDIALLSNFSMLENCEFDDPLQCPEGETREYVEAYANNNSYFLEQFVRAYTKVIHKSPFKLHPVIEDTHWKPQWERPGTLPTFPPTTTQPTTTTTTAPPIVRGNRLQATSGLFSGAQFCQFDNGEMCPFLEQPTNDGINMNFVTGESRPYGPPGPVLGEYYLHQVSNNWNWRRKAWIKVKQFEGVDGCLHMSRYMAGPDPGKITIYRVLGGLYPGNVVHTITNTTTEWTLQQFPLILDDVRPDLSHEMIIEVELGRNGVIAIDDIIFDDRQSC